jgi:hypothetical protein
MEDVAREGLRCAGHAQDDSSMCVSEWLCLSSCKKERREVQVRGRSKSIPQQRRFLMWSAIWREMRRPRHVNVNRKIGRQRVVSRGKTS